MTLFPQKDLVEAARLAERIAPSPDGPNTALALTQAERAFLFNFLISAVNVLHPAPPRRGEHADRDMRIALDFHTRPDGDRAKLVAQDWDLQPSHIAKIASEHREQCEVILRDDSMREVIRQLIKLGVLRYCPLQVITDARRTQPPAIV